MSCAKLRDHQARAHQDAPAPAPLRRPTSPRMSRELDRPVDPLEGVEWCRASPAARRVQRRHQPEENGDGDNDAASANARTPPSSCTSSIRGKLPSGQRVHESNAGPRHERARSPRHRRRGWCSPRAPGAPAASAPAPSAARTAISVRRPRDACQHEAGDIGADDEEDAPTAPEISISAGRTVVTSSSRAEATRAPSRRCCRDTRRPADRRSASSRAAPLDVRPAGKASDDAQRPRLPGSAVLVGGIERQRRPHVHVAARGKSKSRSMMPTTVYASRRVESSGRWSRASRRSAASRTKRSGSRRGRRPVSPPRP